MLLLFNVTVAPPAGALPFRVTVAVELLPPTSEVGFALIEEIVAALTFRVVLRVVPRVAEIVTVVLADTGLVVMLKVALDAPAGTVMLDATCAAVGLLLARATATPPVGAV